MNPTEVTNPKTGEVIKCTITKKEALDRLSKSDNEFGKDLAYKFSQYQKLSDSQWFWVFKLAQKESFESIDLEPGITDKLIEAFENSELHCPSLFFPECKIYYWQGKIKVKRHDSYKGFIDRDKFHPFASPSKELISFLIDFSKDPWGITIRTGKAKGYCCFCQKDLTNPESLLRGYGPICADRYGLPYDHSRQNPIPQEFDVL